MARSAASTIRIAFVIILTAITSAFAQDPFQAGAGVDVLENNPALKAFSTIESIAPPASDLRRVQVEAHLTDDGPAMQQGISWRVFSTLTDDEGKLTLVASAEGGSTDFELQPGEYFLNAAFGRAAATKKLVVPKSGDVPLQSLVLDAGGLILKSVSGNGVPIPDKDLRFSIYTSEIGADGERGLVIADVKPNTVLRLNADTYHIVSEYGQMNAVIRADIQVPAGKLTEATMEHKAARMTFKLVSEAGGEAIADTAWSILTQAGDSLSEVVGAFPSMVLAEGDYIAVAKNKDVIYQREFTVNAGVNKDVEVLLERDRAPLAN